jgi:hypothetical protein
MADPKQKAPESVQLSKQEQSILAEYQQALRDIQQQIQGALRLIVKQRGLEGQWNLDGDRLVKVVAQKEN